MPDKAPSKMFVGQVKRQLKFLRDEKYSYSTLHVYVAGVPEPWEFGPDDEFHFNEESDLLIVRDGPSAEYGNAGVPEHVFGLDTIVATQLA
jgi:hypothetical protein